jgi:hypothetical protein
MTYRESPTKSITIKTLMIDFKFRLMHILQHELTRLFGGRFLCQPVIIPTNALLAV